MSADKVRHLRALGAEIILTRSDVSKGHPEYYQDMAEKMVQEMPGAFWASQFDNPANPKAHEIGTGPEIWEQMDGDLNAFVAGVGSGGTISGIGRFFKSKNPKIQIIVADPEGSVVTRAVKTGDVLYEGGSWLVEGIGEDFIPDNLDLSVIDDGETVSDSEAFAATNELLRQEGILGGSSTGTLLAGALKWCRKQTSQKRVVTFVCDTGNKYLSKAFDEAWLQEQGLTHHKPTLDLRDLIVRRADLGRIISVGPGDTLNTAYGRMRANDVSQLPVLDSQEIIIGLLDEEDLLFAVHDSPSCFSDLVSKHMTTDLDIIDFEAGVDTLYPIFKAGKIAIIQKGSTFLGLITRVDLINHLRRKVA
jgi:cystathionine beta-synthase